MKEEADDLRVEPLIVPDRGDIETGQPTKRELGKWPWAMLGFLLGVALAALFLSGGNAAESGGSVTTVAQEINSGIGEQILGFPDTVNAIVAPGNGRAYELVTWPNRGEQIRRSIPLSDLTSGGRVEFDASGQFLAGFVSSGDGQLLLSGRPNTVTIIASNVSGFAWHDTDGADLAWSTEEDGETLIWVSEDAGRPNMIMRGVGIGNELSAFGEWGFAITEFVAEGDSFSVTTRILDRSGIFVREFDGFVLDSFGDGKFLVQEGVGLRLVDGIRSLGLSAVGLSNEVVTAAAFSPQGDRIAMLGFLSVKVVDVLGEEVFSSDSVRAGANSVDWSSDGRFLAIPGFTSSQVIDIETGEVHTIFQGEIVRSFTTVPIPGA